MCQPLGFEKFLKWNETQGDKNVIPKQQLVIERATQLFMQDQERYPGLGETLPETSELKEAGYLDKAKMELMSNDFERPDPKMVEEVFNEMGINQNESLNAEKIEELKKQQKENTDKIMARLEAIPNLDDMVKAMEKSKSFQQLGQALRPLSATKAERQRVAENIKMELIPGQGWVNVNDPRYKQPEATPIPQPAIVQPEPPQRIEKPQQPRREFHLPTWLKPQRKLSVLDSFGAAMVVLIWGAATGYFLTSYALNWLTLIGLGAFWLVFIVVFRLVIGGILD
jgi:hypothetical protein